MVPLSRLGTQRLNGRFIPLGYDPPAESSKAGQYDQPGSLQKVAKQATNMKQAV